jgi:hypothetical protein
MRYPFGYALKRGSTANNKYIFTFNNCLPKEREKKMDV